MFAPEARGAVFAACVLLLATSLLAPASAQAPGPAFQLIVTPQPSAGLITQSLGEVRFVYSISFQYDATNPTAGQFMINVTVEPVTTVYPGGWQVTSPSATQISMRPSETRQVTLTARLLDDRPAQDQFDVELRFRSQPFVPNTSPIPVPTTFPPQASQSDAETVKVTVEKRLTLAETVTGLARDYAYWFGGVAIALFVLGVVLAKRRKTGGHVLVQCDAPEQTVVPGRGASFPIRVTNDSGERENLRLDVEGVPPGWSAILPLREFDLSSGASTQVWLTLKASDEARAGQSIEAALTATSERNPDRETRVRLRCNVAGSYGPSPEEPAEPPPIEPLEEEVEAEPAPSRRRR